MTKNEIKKNLKLLDKEVEEKQIKERISLLNYELKKNDLVNDIVKIVEENKKIMFDKNNNLTVAGISFFVAISLKIYETALKVKYGNKN